MLVATQFYQSRVPEPGHYFGELVYVTLHYNNYFFLGTAVSQWLALPCGPYLDEVEKIGLDSRAS